jgi:hypothetical protein
MNKQARFLPPTKKADGPYPLNPPGRGFQTYDVGFLGSMTKFMAGSEEGQTAPKSPSPFGKVWQFHRALKGDLGLERKEESVSLFRGIVALLAARQYFALPVVVNVTPQLKAEGGDATLLQQLFEPHVSCVPKSTPRGGPILPFLWHTRMTYFALRKNDGHDAVFAGYSPLTLVYPASKPLPDEVSRQIFWWDVTKQRLTDPTRLPSSHPFYQEALMLCSVLKIWIAHTMIQLHTIPLAAEDAANLSTLLHQWQTELNEKPEQQKLQQEPEQRNPLISEVAAFEAVGARLQQLQEEVQDTLPLPGFFRGVIRFVGGGLPMIKSRRTGTDTLVITYEQARNPKTKIFGVLFGSPDVEKRLRQVPATGSDLGQALGVSAATPYVILDKLFEPKLTKIYEATTGGPPKVNECWRIITHTGEAYLFPFQSKLLDYFSAEQITAGTSLVDLGTGSLAIKFAFQGVVAHRPYRQEECEILDTSMDLRIFPNFAIDSLKHVTEMLPKEEDRRYYARIRLFPGADSMWDMQWLNSMGNRIESQTWEFAGNFEKQSGPSSKGKQKVCVIKAGEMEVNRPSVLNVTNCGLAFVKLKPIDFGSDRPMPWEIGLDFGTSNTCVVRRKTNQAPEDNNAEILRLDVFTTSMLDQWDVDKGRGNAAEGFSAIFDFPYLNLNPIFEQPELGVSNSVLNPKPFFPTQVVHYEDRNAPSPAEPFHLRNGLAFFQNITVTSLLANQVSELIKGFDSLKPAREAAFAPPERFVLNRSLKWGEDADHNIPTTINQAWRKVFLSHLRLQILMTAASQNGKVDYLRASYPKAFTSAQKESYKIELGKIWGDQVNATIFSESAAAAEHVGVKEAQVVYLIDIGGGTADFAVYRDRGLIGECSLKLAGSFFENYFCCSLLFRQAIAAKLKAHDEFLKLNPERVKDFFDTCLTSKSQNKEMLRTAFHGILNIMPPRQLVTDVLELTGHPSCTGFTLTNVVLYSSLAYFAGLVQRDLRSRNATPEAESKFLLRWVGNGSCFLKTLNRGGKEKDENDRFQKVLENLFLAASGNKITGVECDALDDAKSVVAFGLLKMRSREEKKASNIASKTFSSSFADAEAGEGGTFGAESSLVDFYKKDVIPESLWDGLREGCVFRNYLQTLQNEIPRFCLGDQSFGGLHKLGITDHVNWAVEYVKMRKTHIAQKFRERLLVNHVLWRDVARNQPETLQVEPLFITEVAALLEDICEFCGAQKPA